MHDDLFYESRETEMHVLIIRSVYERQGHDLLPERNNN